jgi:lysozyme
MRHINEAGLALIKRFESLQLDAYLCPAGVLTIGYGCTSKVTPGMRITEQEALKRLQDDLEPAEQCVERWVTVPISDNEFSALVCFTFNVGSGAFKGSTLLRKLNADDRAGAAQEFGRWVKGGGVVLNGLVKRRKAEAQLFGHLPEKVEAA